MDWIFDFDVVPAWEVVLRIVLAGGLAALIGLERDMKRKPIDFRAYMIIAVTSCIVAVMAQEIYADYQNSDGPVSLDFMRIVEGVLTGIGFLGAGAIIRNQNGDGRRVVGTATGASIWASGCLGLTAGFGFYGLTMMAFVAVWGILLVTGLLLSEEFKDIETGDK